MSITVTNVAKMGDRTTRFPQHRWHIRAEPYQITPIAIAPVLPGETLKRAVFQSRVVSDPIKNPLIGWWTEYYWFYVKLRDLAGRDDFTAMLVDVDKDLSAYHYADDPAFYHKSNSSDLINWPRLCLIRVTEEYFRDEGETWNTHKIGSLPLAQIMQKSWLDSTINDTNYLGEDEIIPHATGTPDTAVASDAEDAMNKWEFMRAVGMTEMSYEDFLKTFGIRTEAQEIHKPELIRYVREWTYPTNTVDPTDGSPTTALSWSVRERIDKDRFFKEHGFICGYSVTRPKVYLSGQTCAAVAQMDSAFSWLPAIMRDDPYTSLKKVAAGQGPLTGNTDDYWIDIRDLFMYGDQYINFAVSATDAGLVASPTTALEKRYATEASIDALFVDAAGGNNLVKQDGVISLAILGTQVDQTPTQTG